jgi:hypothetical protein
MISIMARQARRQRQPLVYLWDRGLATKAWRSKKRGRASVDATSFDVVRVPQAAAGGEGNLSLTRRPRGPLASFT